MSGEQLNSLGQSEGLWHRLRRCSRRRRMPTSWRSCRAGRRCAYRRGARRDRRCVLSARPSLPSIGARLQEIARRDGDGFDSKPRPVSSAIPLPSADGARNEAFLSARKPYGQVNVAAAWRRLSRQAAGRMRLPSVPQQSTMPRSRIVVGSSACWREKATACWAPRYLMGFSDRELRDRAGARRA